MTWNSNTGKETDLTSKTSNNVMQVKILMISLTPFSVEAVDLDLIWVVISVVDLETWVAADLEIWVAADLEIWAAEDRDSNLRKSRKILSKIQKSKFLLKIAFLNSIQEKMCG